MVVVVVVMVVLVVLVVVVLVVVTVLVEWVAITIFIYNASDQLNVPPRGSARYFPFRAVALTTAPTLAHSHFYYSCFHSCHFPLPSVTVFTVIASHHGPF